MAPGWQAHTHTRRVHGHAGGRAHSTRVECAPGAGGWKSSRMVAHYTRRPSQPSRAPSPSTCRRRRQRPEAPGRQHHRARRRHGRSTLPRSVLLGRSRRAGRGALRPRRSAPRPVHGAPRGTEGAAAALTTAALKPQLAIGVYNVGGVAASVTKLASTVSLRVIVCHFPSDIAATIAASSPEAGTATTASLIRSQTWKVTVMV